MVGPARFQSVTIRSNHARYSGNKYYRTGSSVPYGLYVWELELANSVRYYDPQKAPIFEPPIRWRFLTFADRHWKIEPRIFGLTARKLESTLEILFEAVWPYQAIEHLVTTFQFQPTEQESGSDEYFFDLGVWLSESPVIDVQTLPNLTVPYMPDRKDYAVAASLTAGTKFVAVAPIRKFPWNQVGELSLLWVP